jgi:uncharacterized protein YjcR
MGSPFFGKRRYLDTLKARDLYIKGYCDQQIADVCDVSRDVVREWRKRNGLPGHKTLYKEKKNKHASTLTELAAEARAHGMTYGQYQVARKEGWV